MNKVMKYFEWSAAIRSRRLDPKDSFIPLIGPEVMK